MTASTQPRTRPFFAANGMGRESTAFLHRIFTDPAARPAQIAPDYSNLIVATAQTGDEWSLTGELETRYILPLLRAHNVRFVEVARKGPTKADGVAVLQDSRQPTRLHLDGVYKLSYENRDSGTMPIQSGHHTCAQKSKGEPLDWWRATYLSDVPYDHFIGFNVDEESRIARDKAYAMGGQRTAVHTVSDWGWSAQDCVDYLYHQLGVVWPKSACRQCPFINLAGWPDQLARFIERPQEAVAHVIDEFVTLALNPRSGLYGPGKSLASRLARGHATEVLRLAAERMKSMRWAIYRVRRRYNAPAIAPRSVQALLRGNYTEMRDAVADIAVAAGLPITYNDAIAGAPVRNGDADRHRRLWVRRRAERTYPSLEEFLVAAPAQVADKRLSTFDENWTMVVTPPHVELERRVGRAVKATAFGKGETTARDEFGVVDLRDAA
jgi:hypothetical protein